MKIKFFFILSFITLFSCNTIIKQNELIVSNQKLDFNFSIKNFVINGEIRFLSGKNDVLININDSFLSGEIIPKQDGKVNYVNYSFIYKNKFIRGGYIEEKNIKSLNFSIMGDKLTGTINRQDLTNSIVELIFSNKKITGGYQYDKINKIVKWQYKIDDKKFAIDISKKGKRVYYDFKKNSFTEKQIILFLILEFIRLQG